MWRNCNGDKFYFLPCLHCLKNCSLCEKKLGQPVASDLSLLALSSTPVPLHSFHSHSCAKANLLSASVFLTGYPADARGPWSAERPSHRCAPLPPSRSAKWIYCHCQNFCQFSKGERRRRQRESAREQYGTFFSLPFHRCPDMQSSTQRAFEIISLVNSCLMEARREGKLDRVWMETPKLSFVKYWNPHFHLTVS